MMRRLGMFLMWTGLFLFVSINSVPADVYYVDATGGTDAASGLSDQEAWGTITKVNSFNFQPGNSILFKRGETWREQITVSSSGTKENPITYSSYGTGPKPVINLAETITGWSVHSGNIYVANVDYNVYQVFLDGEFMTLAHHPNNGYLTVDGDTPPLERNYLIDNDLGLSESQVVGADIFLLGRAWRVDETRVIDYTGNKITFEGWEHCCTNYAMASGKKYYLANKLWMLDKAGEWYYDDSSNKLYVWMPDSSHPSSHKIEGSKHLYGFYVNNKENIVIDNLEIHNPVHSGVFLKNSNKFTVSNTDIINSGTMKYYDFWEETGNGIVVLKTESASLGDGDGFILNNKIKNTIHRGIHNKGFAGLLIENNLVENVGMIGSDVYSPKRSTGILVNSPNIVIKGNIIKDIGYSGIHFSQKNTLIENNYITNTMQVLDDGGGIYCGFKNTGGSRIIGNVVTNTGKTGTRIGIYLDDGNTNVQVLNNTCSFATIGIFIHNGQYDTLRGNKIYDVNTGITIKEDMILNEPGYIVGNVIENNTFFLLNEEQVVYKYGNLGNLDFGTFDYNIYSSLYPEHLIKETYGEDGIWKWGKYYDLNTWQTSHGQDQHSKFITQQGSPDPYDNSLFLVNTGPNTKQFAYSDYADGKSWTDIDGNAISWPVTLAGYSSKILLWDGGSSPTSSNDLIAHYTMDSSDISGNTISDKSGNGNDATIYGAVSTTGKISQALYFNGVKDYVETNYVNHLPHWSVGVWVKGNNLPGSDKEAGPVMKQENFLISWDHESSSFREAAGIRVGGTWYPAGFGTLNANTWCHLAATYDGEILKAYKDGKLITGNPNPSGNSDSSSHSVKIGRHAVNDYYFNGAIDEVRIYNYALSADEVSKLYAGGSTLKGDLTGDNQIDIQDIQACVNHILGTQDWGSAADVNGDGAVNILDVQGIVKIILNP